MQGCKGKVHAIGMHAKTSSKPTRIGVGGPVDGSCQQTPFSTHFGLRWALDVTKLNF